VISCAPDKVLAGKAAARHPSRALSWKDCLVMLRLAAAFAIIAAPLHAQGIGAALATHLDRIPVTALSLFTDAPSFEFGDLSAAARAVSAPPEGAFPFYGDAIGAGVRASIGELSDSLLPDLMRNWPMTVGFAISDVKTWSSLSMPPERLVVFGLESAVLPAMTEVLIANGYVATDAQGFPALFVNDVDYGIDFGARDPANPFGGNLGRASRLTVAGDMLVHSPGWPMITTVMTDMGPSLADRPDIAALVASLDALPESDHALVTASLALDPLRFSLAVMPDASGGVPPWSAALFADLSDGRTETVAIGLSYPTHDLAKSAAQAMARHWQTSPIPAWGDTLAALTDAPLSVGVAGEGPFVALAYAETPTTLQGGLVVNSGYALLLQTLYMGQLGLIAPAL
jgi:hypothetical protein